MRSGKTIKEATRHLKIGESTYYQWRAQYLGVEPDQAKRLKELEEENRRLKKLVAEQALDLSILREVSPSTSSGVQLPGNLGNDAVDTRGNY